jgi:uncharacterized membrane-anchored protein YhcB (DUF1043 family)
MTYLRIDRNKFWGWVVVSLLVGLGIGFGTMLLLTSSRSDEVRALNNRVAAAQADLASADASLTALVSQNAQLTVDLDAANAQIASLQGSSSSTTTETSTTTVAIKVTSRTITPSSVVASENVTLTMTAKVTGTPTKVTMRIYNASKSYDKTFTLKKVSTSGKTQTWRATTKAPTAKGTYRFFATATKAGVSVTMTGVSAGTLKVK